MSSKYAKHHGDRLSQTVVIAEGMHITSTDNIPEFEASSCDQTDSSSPPEMSTHISASLSTVDSSSKHSEVEQGVTTSNASDPETMTYPNHQTSFPFQATSGDGSLPEVVASPELESQSPPNVGEQVQYTPLSGGDKPEMANDDELEEQKHVTDSSNDVISSKDQSRQLETSTSNCFVVRRSVHDSQPEVEASPEVESQSLPNVGEQVQSTPLSGGDKPEVTNDDYDVTMTSSIDSSSGRTGMEQGVVTSNASHPETMTYPDHLISSPFQDTSGSYHYQPEVERHSPPNVIEQAQSTLSGDDKPEVINDDDVSMTSPFGTDDDRRRDDEPEEQKHVTDSSDDVISSEDQSRQLMTSTSSCSVVRSVHDSQPEVENQSPPNVGEQSQSTPLSGDRPEVTNDDDDVTVTSPIDSSSEYSKVEEAVVTTNAVDPETVTYLDHLVSSPFHATSGDHRQPEVESQSPPNAGEQAQSTSRGDRPEVRNDDDVTVTSPFGRRRDNEPEDQKHVTDDVIKTTPVSSDDQSCQLEYVISSPYHTTSAVDGQPEVESLSPPNADQQVCDDKPEVTIDDDVTMSSPTDSSSGHSGMEQGFVTSNASDPETMRYADHLISPPFHATSAFDNQPEVVASPEVESQSPPIVGEQAQSTPLSDEKPEVTNDDDDVTLTSRDDEPEEQKHVTDSSDDVTTTTQVSSSGHSTVEQSIVTSNSSDPETMTYPNHLISHPLHDTSGDHRQPEVESQSPPTVGEQEQSTPLSGDKPEVTNDDDISVTSPFDGDGEPEERNHVTDDVISGPSCSVVRRSVGGRCKDDVRRKDSTRSESTENNYLSTEHSDIDQQDLPSPAIADDDNNNNNNNDNNPVKGEDSVESRDQQSAAGSHVTGAGVTSQQGGNVDVYVEKVFVESLATSIGKQLQLCSFDISYHIIDLKRQNRLKVGTDTHKLKVKMQLFTIVCVYYFSIKYRKIIVNIFIHRSIW